MAEPTFLGIEKFQWDLINSFSNWVSAFATIAAVWVSLYLARKAWRPRASVSVGHRLVITTGVKAPPAEIVMFRVVNTGDRPIRVTQIGWRVGLFRRRYAIQRYDETQSSVMPIELSHGQEAHWVVPLDCRDQPWLEYFAEGMLSPHRRISCATLRAQFFTSVGYVFEAKPEDNLLQKLRSVKKVPGPRVA